MHQKWSLCKVGIVHRIGTVEVGAPSVIIAVSSAHRRASLEVKPISLMDLLLLIEQRRVRGLLMN